MGCPKRMLVDVAGTKRKKKPGRQADRFDFYTLLERAFSPGDDKKIFGVAAKHKKDRKMCVPRETKWYYSSHVPPRLT
jgi:hypothetical protein